MTELIMVIAIGGVILGTVIGGQAKYTDAAALKGLVNEISLDIREAQVYGVSVRDKSSGAQDFTGSYGLSFHVAYPSSYVKFIDKAAPVGTYDATSYTTCTGFGSIECLNIIPISRGNRLVNPMCRIAINNTETCDVGRADIVFMRPSTEAKIVYFSNATGAIIPSTGIKGLKIQFTSPGGKNRYVKVYNSGQISVQ